MRVNTEVPLTEGYENGELKNGVGCELEELHTVHKEKPTKKLVGWQRKTSKKKGEEDYPPSIWGIRDLLVAGDPVLHPGEEPLRGELVGVRLAEGGPPPVPGPLRRALLHGGLAGGDVGPRGRGLARGSRSLAFLPHGWEGKHASRRKSGSLEAMKMSARRKKMRWRRSETGWGKMIHPPRYL